MFTKSIENVYPNPRDAENQEMLLNFVINYCSPNHIEHTLEMIHRIRSDRENLDIGGSFIEFLSTPTNLLSTAVSSVSSTALRLSSVGSSLPDEDAEEESSSPVPEENVSLEDLILQDRETEVETRLKDMFDIAIEGLEDTSKFSTAMLCLQATNRSSEWIDQSTSKKDELVLLLLCYYLANKHNNSTSTSGPLPVLETIFNAANASDQSKARAEFKTVHQRLLDFVYGEELVEYGIDPDEFLNDQETA